MTKTLVLATLLVAGAYAKDLSKSKTFIGVDIGYSQVKGYVDNDGDIQYKDDSDIQYGLRIGAQNEKWRTTFIFGYYDNGDTQQNLEEYLLTIDYFLQYPTSTLKPYIGANIGYANYESEFIDDEGGMIYGGQVGFIMDLTEHVNIDLSYRYSATDYDELDRTGGVIFGTNYIF
jgi:opacity protein-like surface antigen